jgi:hypothetical protein|tara:strand:- start:2908 stop:4290 length:1383 start_codon:yes stop_codon:yes gene_type:complete
MKVSEYLKKITPYLKNGKYIFRGVSNSYYSNKTGALRRMKTVKIVEGSGYKTEEELQNVINNPNYKEHSFVLKTNYKGTHVQLTQELINGFCNYNKNLIKNARKQGYGEKNLKELSDLQVLAELQHFGAATCLLDFTKNFLNALWFAVNENPGSDGKVFYLNSEKIEEIASEEFEKKNIDYFLDNKQYFSWSPQKINKRIMAQDSVFVLGSPIIEDINIKSLIVNKADKPVIKYELKEFFNINNSTLFPDLQGFSLTNSTDNAINDNSYNFDSIINYLISEKKWNELQGNYQQFNCEQIINIIETLFHKKIKINKSLLEYANEFISKSKAKELLLNRDIIEILNYTNLNDYDGYSNLYFYFDYLGFENSFIHKKLIKNNEENILKNEWYDDVDESDCKFNKRDYIFSTISVYMKKNNYEYKWKNQKEFENEMNSNPNINSKLKKEYNDFLKFIENLNENL